jgi:hypothetical protein
MLTKCTCAFYYLSNTAAIDFFRFDNPNAFAVTFHRQPKKSKVNPSVTEGDSATPEDNLLSNVAGTSPEITLENPPTSSNA